MINVCQPRLKIEFLCFFVSSECPSHLKSLLPKRELLEECARNHFFAVRREMVLPNSLGTHFRSWTRSDVLHSVADLTAQFIFFCNMNSMKYLLLQSISFLHSVWETVSLELKFGKPLVSREVLLTVGSSQELLLSSLHVLSLSSKSFMSKSCHFHRHRPSTFSISPTLQHWTTCISCDTAASYTSVDFCSASLTACRARLWCS